MTLSLSDCQHAKRTPKQNPFLVTKQLTSGGGGIGMPIGNTGCEGGGPMTAAVGGSFDSTGAAGFASTDPVEVIVRSSTTRASSPWSYGHWSPFMQNPFSAQRRKFWNGLIWTLTLVAEQKRWRSLRAGRVAKLQRWEPFRCDSLPNTQDCLLGCTACALFGWCTSETLFGGSTRQWIMVHIVGLISTFYPRGYTAVFGVGVFGQRSEKSSTKGSCTDFGLAVGCIRSPRIFSNNFYSVVKCCILVKHETSEIFSQLVDV